MLSPITVKWTTKPEQRFREVFGKASTLTEVHLLDESGAESCLDCCCGWSPAELGSLLAMGGWVKKAGAAKAWRLASNPNRTIPHLSLSSPAQSMVNPDSSSFFLMQVHILF